MSLLMKTQKVSSDVWNWFYIGMFVCACTRAIERLCLVVLQWWWWCDFLHPLSLSRKTSLYIKHLLSFSFCDKYNFVSFIETYHLKHDEWDLNNFLSYTFLISRPTSFDTAEFTIWVNVKFNDTSVFVCLESLQYGRGRSYPLQGGNCELLFS